MKLSIRLKLTLWYSVILIITSLVYIIFSNVVVTRQLHKGPPEMDRLIKEAQTELFEEYRDSGIEPGPLRFTNVIEEIRERDLARIRAYSIGIFFVLMVLSFGGGYVIAGRTLRPLYESLRAQKQFIANASHELKTPLTIVQTNLEAALQEISAQSGSPKAFVQAALSSTEFMNQLIEDLLILALPPEASELHTVDLGVVVAQAVTRLQPVAKQSHKTIVQRVPDQTLADGAVALTVQGNQTLLERAVMNCVENAIRYATANITVELTSNVNHPIITIHDDGPGIPAEVLPKLTERFYRVDQGRARATGGTGLGLAITKAIMERHHGKIEITSNTKQGTTVALAF